MMGAVCRLQAACGFQRLGQAWTCQPCGGTHPTPFRWAGVDGGVSRPPRHPPTCLLETPESWGVRKGGPGHVTPFCPCDQGPSSDSLCMPAAPGLGERASRGQKWGQPPDILRGQERPIA